MSKKKEDNSKWRDWLISQGLIKEDVISGWYALSERYMHICSGGDDPEGEFTKADLISKREELVEEVG